MQKNGSWWWTGGELETQTDRLAQFWETYRNTRIDRVKKADIAIIIIIITLLNIQNKDVISACMYFNNAAMQDLTNSQKNTVME